MAFAQAVHKQSQYIRGDNGGIKLKTSGSYFLDAFTNLNKDSTVDYIRNCLSNMIEETKTITDRKEKEFAIKNLFRLWVHKRHVRDGEKEKILTYRYFLELYNIFPETCCQIVRENVFADIGYWKDGLLIWGLINDMDMPQREKYNKYNKLILAIRKSMISQRDSDLKLISSFVRPKKLNSFNSDTFREHLNNKFDNRPSISRVGEWCVREKSVENQKLYWYIEDESGKLYKKSHVAFMIHENLLKKVANKYTEWPADESVPFAAKKAWRKFNTLLNTYLEITENLMAGNRWDIIDPSKVPSMCASRKIKALLNEKVKVTPDYDEEETGNRDPYNEDRVNLRKRTKEMFQDPSKINVKTLFPHVIAYKATHSRSTSVQEFYEASWKKKVMETKEEFVKIQNEISEEMGELARAMASGNIVGCADVSGSMTYCGASPNTPLDIAVGLTAFISCIASDNFKNVALSFTDVPQVFSFAEGTSVRNRINQITSRVGYSTNYEGLHKALLELCVKNKVPENELPVLWVGTDGEFNSMDYNVGTKTWETIHESITKMWFRAGYKKVPLMVYHNLNSSSNGVQASQDYKGVILLGGRSESVLKFILYGEAMGEETTEVLIDGEKVQVKTSSVTPYDIFVRAMTSDKYSKVENIIEKSEEGLCMFV